VDRNRSIERAPGALRAGSQRSRPVVGSPPLIRAIRDRRLLLGRGEEAVELLLGIADVDARAEVALGGDADVGPGGALAEALDRDDAPDDPLAPLDEEVLPGPK